MTDPRARIDALLAGPTRTNGPTSTPPTSSSQPISLDTATLAPVSPQASLVAGFPTLKTTARSLALTVRPWRVAFADGESSVSRRLRYCYTQVRVSLIASFLRGASSRPMPSRSAMAQR